LNAFIDLIAKKLQGMEAIQIPPWSAVVKTGSHAERPPQEADFWFKRCASVLVTLYTHNVGVRRLQHKYGGRHAHVVSRSHHRPAGGKLIRVAMQQLEKAGLVKKEKIGRSISPAGRSLVDHVAAELKV
jgi:small subunit ribosomal protein S19e